MNIASKIYTTSIAAAVSHSDENWNESNVLAVLLERI